MVGHGHLAEDAEVTAVKELGIGDLLPLLLHRPAQRGEVDGGMDGVHIEGAEEGIAMGDDDGDEVDAALVVVVALVTRTVGWVLWDGSVLWHGKLGLCVFVGGGAYVLTGNKAISVAKIRLFDDTAKFLPAFITFATAKKLQKKSRLVLTDEPVKSLNN